jgi:hypothetical protein
MIGTNLQRKRSEHGASLILLVSIIGVAFIVTVASFLVAASYSQDRARLASAKVDVANREDVLMREILRETATGMLNAATPETWTTIMTNATGNLLATSYVDPNELATLGITGVTTANLGDIGGNPLDIFQGYTGAPHSATGTDFAGVPWSEIPFGGTSGVSNDAFLLNSTNYTPTQRAVAPPHMNWSGNTTLSLATATTTPQEFFLGSLYTAADPTGVTGPAKLSISNRWGQIFYPAIRFGYKQPNYDPSGKPIPGFVARRVWWRIPIVYEAAQPNAEYQARTVGASSANNFPKATVNYILSVYEIPSQLSISGNANLQIGLNDDGTAWGSGTIAGPSPSPGSTPGPGSIYAGQIQLYGGTYNGVSSQQNVNVINSATVGSNGVVYTDSAFDDPGTQPDQREGMMNALTPGVAAPVSVAGNDGKVLLVPVMPGTDFYMQAPGNAPTHWDLYARPYYRCRVRVLINNDSTVTISYLPDTVSPPQPDQILGFPDNSAAVKSVNFLPTSTTAPPNSRLDKYGIHYTSNPTGNRTILIINVLQMVQTLGNPAQLYSIYIGNPPNPPDPSTNPGIAITGTNDLSSFTSGLSIVTNQTLYLFDSFNQGQKDPTTGLLIPGTVVPTSLYAPEIRHGISVQNSQINPQVNLISQGGITSQVAVVAKPAPSPAVNPLSFMSGNGSRILSSNITAKLNEVIDPTPWSTTSPTGLPPITALSLLFTIEKERTN